MFVRELQYSRRLADVTVVFSSSSSVFAYALFMYMNMPTRIPTCAWGFVYVYILYAYVPGALFSFCMEVMRMDRQKISGKHVCRVNITARLKKA